MACTLNFKILVRRVSVILMLVPTLIPSIVVILSFMFLGEEIGAEA